MIIQNPSTKIDNLKNQINENHTTIKSLKKRLSWIAVIIPLLTVSITQVISYLSAQKSTKTTSESNIRISETTSKTDLSKNMLTFTKEVLLMPDVSDEEKKMLLERQLIAYIHLVPKYGEKGQILVDSMKIDAIRNSSEMLKEMFKKTPRRYIRGYVLDELRNMQIKDAKLVLAVSCEGKDEKIIGRSETNEQGYFSIDIDMNEYCENESFILTTSHDQYKDNSSVFETLLVNQITLIKK